MAADGPWLPGGAARAGQKQYAPATLRNRDAIAEVLRAELPTAGRVLEVASGSGEHAVYFATLFPQLEWQPSDPDPAALGSIAAWVDEAGLPNLLQPVMVDAQACVWPVERADAVFCANMAHISPWEATLGLMAGAGRLLKPGAPLIVYGPFTRDGVPTAPSNLAFDAQLQDRDPRWGLRSVEAMNAAASANGLKRVALYEMPANNLTLIWRAIR